MKPSFKFDVTPTEAVALQKQLRESLKHIPLKNGIRTIAGVDVSFNKFEEDVYAGVIILSYPDLEPIEHSCVKAKATFPYVPGLLSFREIPPLLQAWKNLETKPDVVIVDGHGIAHPRRLGIAAHFGLVADVPTIGAGKSRLYGTYDDPGAEPGSRTDIVDPKTGETIGAAMRTKKRSNPILVSPGHLITLSEAVKVVESCLRGYRLPEPTRRAHLLVNAMRKGEIEAHKKYR